MTVRTRTDWQRKQVRLQLRYNVKTITAHVLGRDEIWIHRADGECFDRGPWRLCHPSGIVIPFAYASTLAVAKRAAEEIVALPGWRRIKVTWRTKGRGRNKVYEHDLAPISQAVSDRILDILREFRLR